MCIASHSNAVVVRSESYRVVEENRLFQLRGIFYLFLKFYGKNYFNEEHYLKKDLLKFENRIVGFLYSGSINLLFGKCRMEQSKYKLIF